MMFWWSCLKRTFLKTWRKFVIPDALDASISQCLLNEVIKNILPAFESFRSN